MYKELDGLVCSYLYSLGLTPSSAQGLFLLAVQGLNMLVLEIEHRLALCKASTLFLDYFSGPHK